MPPLVSLSQISCYCPAGLSLSLAGSCSSTDLKRNAAFRLQSVLWQRGPTVILLNTDRLGGCRRPVAFARHHTQGSSSEHRPAEQQLALPSFGLSCSAELTGGSRAWGVHRAASPLAMTQGLPCSHCSPLSRSLDSLGNSSAQALGGC